MKSFRLLLLLGALTLTASPLYAQHEGHDMKGMKKDTKMTADTSGTIIGVARAQGTFMTLLKAIDAAGLTETLMGDGPFTVFAPTDEAFGKLDDDAVEQLLAPGNRDQLRQLLSYHVIEGERFTARDLQSRAAQLSYQLQTMGGLLAISSAETGVFIGGAAMAVPDVKASNGIIHVMSSVITPPALNDKLGNN